MALKADPGQQQVAEADQHAHDGSSSAEKRSLPDEVVSSSSDPEVEPIPVKNERAQDGTDTASEDEDDDSNHTANPSAVGRVLSRLTSRSSVDPGPPPDGGWLAWSQCKYI
jgi:hypothetical protein